MMCDKCFNFVEKEYSHEAVMKKLRLSMGEKKFKSMKGRKGQSLFPDSF
jgi:hypothetical protein